jgi:hypothetical protein
MNNFWPLALYFNLLFHFLATGAFQAKFTGDFPDLMSSSDCLTYEPIGDPTDKLVMSQPCPESIGICKRRIGK